LKESKLLQCFSCIVLNPAINEPVTKYEKKWLSMNKYYPEKRKRTISYKN